MDGKRRARVVTALHLASPHDAIARERHARPVEAVGYAESGLGYPDADSGGVPGR